MYEYFAFVDESVAKKYRLCIVAIPSDQLKFVRTELQKLRLKGQSRIHMKQESHRRRVQILKVVVNLPMWECLILETTVYKSDFVYARKSLFVTAVAHRIFASIRHITIEDSTERIRDKKLLTWLKNNTIRDFDFDFEKATKDECLWLADILAWAYSRGGETRKLIRNRVDLVKAPF